MGNTHASFGPWETLIRFGENPTKIQKMQNQTSVKNIQFADLWSID